MYHQSGMYCVFIDDVIEILQCLPGAGRLVLAHFVQYMRDCRNLGNTVVSPCCNSGSGITIFWVFVYFFYGNMTVKKRNLFSACDKYLFYPLGRPEQHQRKDNSCMRHSRS